MIWHKLGRIFNPERHTLPNGCVQFAQSPQALVFDDFVRIYFSTRGPRDAAGKYTSQVAFVDMEKNLRDCIRVSDRTVMPLGEPGCFDEHGIFPINVVRDKDRILAYTTGWNRRQSVSVDTAVGLAVSTDQGMTFQRVGQGPVLAASLHEPFLVGDAFVRLFDGVWHMWYIFGTRWAHYATENTEAERTYKIGHATSADGIAWQKDEARQIISDRLGPDESQALPTVIRIGTRYHMFFCYRESFDFRHAAGRGYRIGHAWSDDLEDWTRDDEDPSLTGTCGEWDSDMQCYPHVFECDGKVYLLYNGNDFGRGGFGLAELEA
jgi:sucrose-6-phosphate hydrolase SacC (GH32 family)